MSFVKAYVESRSMVCDFLFYKELIKSAAWPDEK